MSRLLHFAGALVAALLVCSGAEAQIRGGGAPAGAMPARPIPPMRMTVSARAPAISAAPSATGVQTNPRITVIQVSPNVPVRSSNAPLTSFGNFDNESAVPGLGFDYVHLAAISGNFRNSTSSGFRRGGHRQDNFSFTPIFLGGYPYYSDFIGSPDYQQIQQQPQIIVIQQPAPVAVVQQAAPAMQESSDPRNDAAAATAPPPAAPVHDVGEFILVRRDGRILFAAAYSVIGTQLRYVTPEGIRRTLPLDELDADATQEMNEARGTTLQLHN
jgi:hypothetical protein